jgi:hypothetical protein
MSCRPVLASAGGCGHTGERGGEAAAAECPAGLSERTMLHYSCDLCKRPIDVTRDVRHVVKIEVFPAVEDLGTDAELADIDNLEEMHELLESLDDQADDADDNPTRSLRFDLCDACRQRYLKNPLGAKTAKQFKFSNN